MRKEYFVYILKCADERYYTGVTNNLPRRLEEHTSGMNTKCYTFELRPVKLVYSEVFRNIRDAIHCEKVIKDWSKKKREALIRGDFEALRLFSKKKFPAGHQRKQSGIRFRRLQHKRCKMRNNLYATLAPRTFALPARTTRDDKAG